MDLDQLEVLVTVSQERSFSRAAVRLHRTQSAVSQAIRRLEGEIGEPLVDRSSKTGTLTDAGRVLEEYGQRMLSLRREARTAVQELGNLQRGRVSVAVNEHTVMHLVPILAAVRARYPQLHVEARRLPASQIPAEVLARGVEIGAVTYRPAQGGLAAHRIATDELVLVTAPGHALATRRQVSLRDLARELFFAHAQRSPYRERVVKSFERHQVPLRIIMELPTLEAIKRLVELGLGLAILPRLVVAAEVRRGELAALPIRELRVRRPVYLITRAGAELSHAARAFFACAPGSPTPRRRPSDARHPTRPGAPPRGPGRSSRSPRTAAGSPGPWGRSSS